MKQKVVIRAKIVRKGRVLLLRRHGGRDDIVGKYELPGGALHDREQPLDSLKRSLQVHAALEPESARLCDVASFVDPLDRDLQYLFVVYDASVDDFARIILDDEYDRYVWRKNDEINFAEITDSTAMILGISCSPKMQEIAKNRKSPEENEDEKTTVIVHSDGGSRGNPGPSASAYIVENGRGEILDRGGEYIGDFLTSDVAEYYGVLLGLRAAKKLGARDVTFYSDDLMVVDQLNGMFHVKELDRKIYGEIERLWREFPHVRFRHVHREYNREADALVNKILNEFSPKSAKNHAKMV